MSFLLRLPPEALSRRRGFSVPVASLLMLQTASAPGHPGPCFQGPIRMHAEGDRH